MNSLIIGCTSPSKCETPLITMPSALRGDQTDFRPVCDEEVGYIELARHFRLNFLDFGSGRGIVVQSEEDVVEGLSECQVVTERRPNILNGQYDVTVLLRVCNITLAELPIPSVN
jgi:hypothetical protein